MLPKPPRMLPRPPLFCCCPPPRMAPNKPPKPATPELPFCLPKRARMLGAMEARMLLTALEATPLFCETPLMTEDRLLPKMWLKILEPSELGTGSREIFRIQYVQS